MNKTISVLGGSRAEPNSPEYGSAYQLGNLLGHLGYSIAVGGYNGLMEAIGRGASDAGARVNYVITTILEANAPDKLEWVTEEIRLDNIREHMYFMVSAFDAVVILPGGIGTLGELGLLWTMLQLGQLPLKPYIIFGSEWKALLDQFYGDGRYIKQENMLFWKYANSPQHVADFLKAL